MILEGVDSVRERIFLWAYRRKGRGMYKNKEIIDKLKEGNKKYLEAKTNDGDISAAIRKDTTENGQHPYAIVVTCSDSRVIPESIFSAGIGEIFVIRVAGNVIGSHQLGSIEYAAAHLGTKVIIVLGHTHCGAVGAAMQGGAEGNIKYLTDEIKIAIGDEKDDYKACGLNVNRSVDIIKKEFADHEEIKASEVDVVGAIYDIEDGHVDWITEE